MREQNKKADWLPVILYILITLSVSFLSGLIIGFTSAINGQDIDINSTILIVGSLVIPNLIITIVFIIIY